MSSIISPSESLANLTDVCGIDTFDKFDLLESVIANASDAVLLAEADAMAPRTLQTLYANSAFYAMTGYQPVAVLGQIPPILQATKGDRLMRESIQTALEQERSVKETLVLSRQDGSQLWVDVSITPLPQRSRQKRYWLIWHHDISKQKRLEVELKALQGRLATLESSLPGLAFSCDSYSGLPNCGFSGACLKMTGYGFQELASDGSVPYHCLVHPDDFPQLHQTVETAIANQQPYVSEYRIYAKSGEEKWVREKGRGIYSERGEILGWDGFIADITELKQAQSCPEAFYDQLTGLFNRAFFMERLAQCVEQSQRDHNYILAVLFLDLDRFKVVNDSLGHIVGDKLLQGVAQRLRNCIRESDTVARLAGDEFTILLAGIENTSFAIQVSERIQEQLNVPFCLDDHEVQTSASIGIATSTVGYHQPEDLLRNADLAMYRAKAMGKARCAVFTLDMHNDANHRLRLELDLRQAIERQEFQLYYQPIVSLKNDAIVGFEALIRWNHPSRGLVSPAEFIPTAEETGLISPISWWVLSEACRQLQIWQAQFPMGIPLSMNVNFSSKQFTEVGLFQWIQQTLQETGVATDSLELEITESAIMENAQSTVDTLQQIKTLGIGLAIDDFGTGYSSLSYLHRFPLDTLKIDRSFVSSMEHHQNLQIVQTIVGLAQNLGMDVVAEGVETAEQLAQLRALGCTFGQGYFFSKPVNAETATKLLQQRCLPALDVAPEPGVSLLQLQIHSGYSYRPLLGRTSWTIGRSHDSEILLSDQTVANRHAMVQRLCSGQFFFVDLGSKQGSYINDQPVTWPTCLHDGDRITLGNTELQFQASLCTPNEALDSAGKTVVMSHSSTFQGEIWQAALTSQGITVIWQTADDDLAHTLDQLTTAGLPLPDLLLIDKTIPGLHPESFCDWLRHTYPEVSVIFTSGIHTRVAPSERQRLIDHGALDILTGFSESHLMINLLETLNKVTVILKALNGKPVQQRALVSALTGLHAVVRNGVFE